MNYYSGEAGDMEAKTEIFAIVPSIADQERTGERKI